MKAYKVEWKEKDYADYLSGISNCYYTAVRYFLNKNDAFAIAQQVNGKVTEIHIEG